MGFRSAFITTILLSGVLCWRAWSSPCALIQIPTADVIDKNQCYLDTAITPNSGDGDFLSDCVFESCFGVKDGLECGFDFVTNSVGEGAFFFKQHIRKHSKWTAAFGVNGIGVQDISLNPYIVFSSNTKPFRTHLGMDYIEDECRIMLGAERVVSDRFTLLADWISGSDGAWSAGFNYTFGRDDAFGLMAGVIKSRSDGDSYLYINIGRSFQF
jgi:hypothetical protein